MRFTSETIDYVAKLARLAVNSEERIEFANELTGIVEYVEKLNELDILDIVPTAHILPLKNVLREDEVKCEFTREENLKNAPNKKDGCFQVPRVVE
jgi:aspartyl-tRNA(Asn)/glutamyl-tRNA(Gln) amidotransferase subunit C